MSKKESCNPENSESIHTNIANDTKKQLLKNLFNPLKTGLLYVTGIFLITGAFIVVELYSDQKVLPRTKAGGLEIGYANVEKVKEQIKTAAEKYLNEPVIFQYGDKKISLTLRELGLQFAVEQTLKNIPVYEFMEQNPLHLTVSLLTEKNVAFQFHMDPAKILAVLEEKFHLNSQRAKNAQLVLKGGKFIVEPEVSGMAVNQTKLLKSLRENASQLHTTTIHLFVEPETSRITASQLEKQKDRFIALLEKPITINIDGKKLTLKLTDHLEAVQFTEKTALELKNTPITLPLILGEQELELPEKSSAHFISELQISLKPEKIQPFLEEKLVAAIERPTSSGNIYRDKNGKIVIEGKAEDGKKVSRNQLLEGIALAANQQIQTVNVPVLVEKAPLEISNDLKKLGIKQLIGGSYTTYRGSPANRMHNINVGIQKYNGLIIKPGEEFSFNKYLGEITSSDGFKVEKVIKQNKVEYELGGGICQVSTTAYRAALMSGLPITQRAPHSWIVPYYEQVLGRGLDSTIYPGVVDLKFINDTPGHILIQAYSEGTTAYFKFYGTSDGRTSKLEGPIGKGLHYKWYRHLKKEGKETTETITSIYRPIPPPQAANPPPQAGNRPPPVAVSPAAPQPVLNNPVQGSTL